MDREKIIQVLFEVVDNLNRQLPPEQKLQKTVETVITGANSRLDSLGLINLVVATEQKMEDEFGVTVTLTDDALWASEDGPFRTLGTLADYLSYRIEE